MSKSRARELLTPRRHHAAGAAAAPVRATLRDGGSHGLPHPQGLILSRVQLCVLRGNYRAHKLTESLCAGKKSTPDLPGRDHLK